ncbi:toll-like receptor 5 isoform X2 [Rhineura floridana]|uniref:toll-like receptor 5 isoform X2 n=1 Tax=Rhineura floridana TaxID=261503 RepID=UPI002AC83804|nr:toll-like receptor 5 isoform X2 [Rhineura floridana]XP_061481092.1 toll-like receptor 5 isoform X2 [Rhineura floridana]
MFEADFKGKTTMLHCHLIFLIGMTLVYREICAVPQCAVKDGLVYYDACNLTEVPPLPEDIVLLSLNFNFIQEVNSSSFPLLKRLLILSLGSQKIYPVIIGKDTFRNLPNLQQLDLGFNNMIVLDPQAFRGLANLNKLLLYKNGLNGSILEEDYLQDLVSLEFLDLAFNEITRVRPHPSLYNMQHLRLLNLKLNHIETICEGDLDSFHGKVFTVLIINSNGLYRGNSQDWATCGNPFKNIILDTLDVGGNGWDVATTQQFCTAIQGTALESLKLSSHSMGSSFGFNNLQDPNNDTFAGLSNSGLRLLDISHGFIFSLNPHVFQYLSDLKWLDLNKNKINQIQKGAFFGLWNLQYLNLSYNLLGELFTYTFEGLENVLSIDLQHNHIGVIGGAPFKGLPRLQTVNLGDNALKVILSLPNLSFAFLAGNRLQSRDYNRIVAINATFLDLEGNRMDNLGDLYELLRYPVSQYIILRNNRFSYCDKYNDIAENNQLQYLDLGDNMLKLVWERLLCLDVFKVLSKLQVLHLNNNYLSFLPEGIFSGLVSLKRLNLASNLLTYISHNTFPASLRKLELSSNQLLHPDLQLFATLDYLDITYNRFYCDCLLSSLIVWLNQTNVTLAGSPNEMFCFGPPDFAGIPLYALTVDNCNEDKILEPLQLSLFIFTCVVLTMFLIAVIVFTRFRGTCFIWYKTMSRVFLKEQPPELDKKTYRYDAYVCYSSKDFEWVQNSLIRHLDFQYSDKNKFALCFEDRDFLPGEDHITNIRDAIWNCRKTICVVTKQFLKDGWCVEAFNFAQSRYFCDLKDVLIMVVAGSLSQYQLMKYQPVRAFLQRGRYLRWPEDPQDVEWFLNALSHRILKEKEVKKKPKKKKVTKKPKGKMNPKSLELNIVTVS